MKGIKVPEGWKKIPLKCVAEVRSGIAKGSKKIKDPVEVPYLRVANVQDGWLDLNEIKTIKVEKQQIDRYRLKVGDVLLTEGGDFDKLGRGDVWKGHISLCLHQNHVFCVRPDQRKLISYFLAALAGSQYGKWYFLNCSKRSTNLASINSTQLKGFPILIPPLPEQTKIARILSTWDRAIETTEKLIENSRRQKKALMQQLLTGKKRLPGFEGIFKKYHLKDLAYIDKKSLGKNTPGNLRFLYISLSDVTRGKISNRLKSYQYTQAPSRAKRIVTKGDILFALVRPQLKAFAKIKKDRVFCIASTGFAVITPFDNVCGNYIYHCLFSDYTTGQVNSMVAGSNYPAVSANDVKKLVFYCPSYSEQKAIAKLLDAFDNIVVALEKKVTSLKVQKQALMQQLLTGKKRVSIDSENN